MCGVRRVQVVRTVQCRDAAIREHFPAILGWQLRIIASDISRDVLARARQGSYSQLEVNGGLPAPLLLKYFAKKGERWQLNDEVRRMVKFLEINLVEPWPAMPTMDIIFMRNVLIYVGVDMKRALLTRVRRLLKPDGVLLLGCSESTIYLDESFEPFPPGVLPCFACVRDVVRPSQEPSTSSRSAGRTLTLGGRSSNADAPPHGYACLSRPSAAPGAIQLRSISRADRTILRFTVDRHLDIKAIRTVERTRQAARRS